MHACLQDLALKSFCAGLLPKCCSKGLVALLVILGQDIFEISTRA